MNRRFLSTSPYPYISEDKETVNNELTDTSTPAATMFYPDLNGSMQLEKPITNIQMTDGLVSFDFMVGVTEIKAPMRYSKKENLQMYNLSGYEVKTPVQGQIYIMKESDGKTHKKIYRNGK
jgi:hypothetical protein